jgi:hypothetical protein
MEHLARARLAFGQRKNRTMERQPTFGQRGARKIDRQLMRLMGAFVHAECA